MRAYRSVWRAIVAVLAALALVVGGSSIGWIALLGTAAGMAVTGAVVSFAWVEDPARRWRSMTDLALWFGVGAVLMLGLPTALGPWALFVLVGIGATCPPLLDLVRKEMRDRRPAATPDSVQRLEPGALERRWVRTSRELRELRDRHGDVDAMLALVAEREHLLDEIERRDPIAFDAVLVRAGWRERQDH